MSHHIQKAFFAFSKVFMLLSMWPSFKSINSSALSRKKYDGDNFTPTFRQQLRNQNTSVGIGSVEFTEPSDTWTYKPFFPHCILQTILHIYMYSYGSYLCGTKSFVLKTDLYFTFFCLVWGDIQCYIIKGSVYLLLFL